MLNCGGVLYTAQLAILLGCVETGGPVHLPYGFFWFAKDPSQTLPSCPLPETMKPRKPITTFQAMEMTSLISWIDAGRFPPSIAVCQKFP